MTPLLGFKGHIILILLLFLLPRRVEAESRIVEATFSASLIRFREFDTAVQHSIILEPRSKLGATYASCLHGSLQFNVILLSDYVDDAGHHIKVFEEAASDSYISLQGADEQVHVIDCDGSTDGPSQANLLIVRLRGKHDDSTFVGGFWKIFFSGPGNFLAQQSLVSRLAQFCHFSISSAVSASKTLLHLGHTAIIFPFGGQDFKANLYLGSLSTKMLPRKQIATTFKSLFHPSSFT